MLFSIPFSNMRRRFAARAHGVNRGAALIFGTIPIVMVRSIIAAGLIGSSLALWLSLGSAQEEHAARTAALTLVVSWSFLGAGLVALGRERRFGALMCAVGLAVFLAPLGDAGAALPYTAGLVLGSLWIGILVHAIAAYPSGRLPSRAATVIVVAAYTCVTVGQLAVILFDDLRAGCPDCPRNLVLIADDPSAAFALLIVVS